MSKSVVASSIDYVLSYCQGWGLAGLALSLSLGTAHAQAPPRDPADCADFPDQAAAQSYLRANSHDPARLDEGGRPGVACEHLPCPCNTVPVYRGLRYGPLTLPADVRQAREP